MNASGQFQVVPLDRHEGALARYVCAFAAAALILSGCAGGPAMSAIRAGTTQAADQLIRFDTCSEALHNLRAAASKVVGPQGFAESASAPPAGRAADPSSSGLSAGPGGAPATASQGAADTGLAPSSGISSQASYSSTNTATPGVDEPDLVKTDGRRIVTVIGGILRVVDAQSKQLTGVLDLSSWTEAAGGAPVNLLLAGDHALVLISQGYQLPGTPVPDLPASPAGADSLPAGIFGPRLLLIDLSETTPRIMSAYTIDGALVDARQVGSVARVIIHSTPRVYFPSGYVQSEQQRTAANRVAVKRAQLDSWLPRYAVTSGQAISRGRVNCTAVNHPVAATYTGTSMLTVLTFDLNGNRLGDGQPVTVVRTATRSIRAATASSSPTTGNGACRRTSRCRRCLRIARLW
jgi:beta propeller domain-containing protein